MDSINLIQGGTSGRLLCTMQSTCVFHNANNVWIAEALLASQELCSMELVINIWKDRELMEEN